MLRQLLFLPLVAAQLPGTPYPPAPLPYPDGVSENNSVPVATNEWNNATLSYPSLNGLDRQRAKRDDQFQTSVEHEASTSLKARDVSSPGNSSQPGAYVIASFNYGPWQGGPAANTPAVTIQAKVKYWFLLSANVNIKSVDAWGIKKNKGAKNYDALTFNGKGDKRFPKDANTNGNGTLYNTRLTIQTDVDYDIHFFIQFWWGQPWGNITLLADPSSMPVKPPTS